MNRSRVIIAVGIVVLILIGLFAWLGGDDPAETPVAGQPQEAGQDSATTATPEDASPAQTAAVQETAPDTRTGSEAGGSEVGERGTSATESAAPAPAPAETEAAQSPDSATDGGVAPDRSETAAAADEGTMSSRTASAGAETATGTVAEVTEAPEAGDRVAPADTGGDGSTAGMGSGAVAEMRPPAEETEPQQDGAPLDRQAQTETQTSRGQQPAATGQESPEPASPGSSTETETQADDRSTTGEREVAALAPDTSREEPAAGRQTAGASTGSEAPSRDEKAPAEGRSGADRSGADRSGPDLSGTDDDAARPAGEAPEETAALERRTREGTGSATPDTSAGGASRTDDSAAAAGFPLPSFDIVRISQDCRAVIAGRAMPRALVEVSLGGDLLGQVTADRRGEWVLIPDQPLRPGPGEMRLSVTPKDGPSVAGREGVIVSVPDCGGGEGEGQEIIAVRTDDRDNRPSRVLQLPGMSGPGGDLRLDAVDYDEAGKLILSGRAEPSTRVNIYANNAPVGQVRTDDEGRWSLLVDDKVPLGPQTLRLDQVGARGGVKSRVEFPFSRASFSDLDLNERNVIVQPGNSLWRIARRVYGEGLRYTVIYQANTEQIRDPDLIYPGQIFSLPGEGQDAEGAGSSRG